MFDDELMTEPGLDREEMVWVLGETKRRQPMLRGAGLERYLCTGEIQLWNTYDEDYGSYNSGTYRIDEQMFVKVPKDKEEGRELDPHLPLRPMHSILANRSCGT